MTLESLATRTDGAALPLTMGALEWRVGAWYFDQQVLNDSKAILAPPEWTGDQDDYNPPGVATAFGIEVTTDADRNLTGIWAHRRQRRLLVLLNRGSHVITLKHNSSSSELPHRILGPGGVDFALSAGESCWLLYDRGSDGWRPVGPV